MTENRNPIPVVVNGAAGKMGREVIKAVARADDMILVGAVDRNPAFRGQDVGEVAGCEPLEVPILDDLQSVLVLATQEKVQGVMVDLPIPTVFMTIPAVRSPMECVRWWELRDYRRHNCKI